MHAIRDKICARNHTASPHAIDAVELIDYNKSECNYNKYSVGY